MMFNCKKNKILYTGIIVMVLIILYQMSVITKLTYENKNLCKKMNYIYQKSSPPSPTTKASTPAEYHQR